MHDFSGWLCPVLSLAVYHYCLLQSTNPVPFSVPILPLAIHRFCLFHHALVICHNTVKETLNQQEAYHDQSNGTFCLRH